MGLFLGDAPVEIYFNGAAAGLPVQGVFFGPVQVFPTGSAVTVPGKPTITSAVSAGVMTGEVSFTAPDDGGSPITGYNVYANGSLVDEGETAVGGQLTGLNFEPGDSIEIAAINAVGEGPKSDPVEATEAL
jgi:hypothetical protein